MIRKLQHIVLCAMMVLMCAPTMQAQEAENDTMYYAMLHEVYCYAPLRFKNKQQERFYWRTVRDVKKTLPYAKRIAREIEQAEDTLAQMDDRTNGAGGRNASGSCFANMRKISGT